MKDIERTGVDEIVARWTRATDHAVPAFTPPIAVRRSRPSVLAAGVAAVVLVGAVGAIALGPRLAENRSGGTAEQALDWLRTVEGARFQIVLDWVYEGGFTQGLFAEGTIAPRAGEVAATARGTGTDPSMPMFGGPEGGAVVMTEGRLFVKAGQGPWEEIPPDGDGDGRAVLLHLMDFDRVATAMASALDASFRVSAVDVNCGETRCHRHEVGLTPDTMVELGNAITGSEPYEPPDDMARTTAFLLVDDAGRLIALDGSFVAGDTTISLHLELEPLDSAPTIEKPIP